jgi:hypothetical protein
MKMPAWWELREGDTVEVAPNAPRRREVALDDDTVTIYNLPPNVSYLIEVFDSTGVRLDDITGASTGAPWGGTGIPPVGTVCGDTKTISTAFVGGPPSNAYYRFLSFKGTGDEPTANSYYDVIDPSDERANLRKFWEKNHFNADGTGGTRTFFVNNNDLGLGRDMNCKQTGADVACWVTNTAAPIRVQVTSTKPKPRINPALARPSRWSIRK